MKFDWSCTECGGSGHMTISDEESFTEVLKKFHDSHFAVSPNCRFDLRHFRLNGNPSGSEVVTEILTSLATCGSKKVTI